MALQNAVTSENRISLLVATLAPLSACGEGRPEPPNLILVVADTLRADYLGCYGFDGDVSPILDRLAGESVVFENCFSQAPRTKPSVASLLTSLYPGTHGLTDHEGEFGSEEHRTSVLPDSAVTLAEILRERGYRTGAFVANSFLARDYGFGQGFDIYDDHAAQTDTPADEILVHASRWLEHSDQTRPFFLYLHFMDVHAPYDAGQRDYEALQGEASLGADGPLTDAEVPYNRWYNIEKRAKWATDEMRHRVAYWRTRYAAGVRAFDRRLLSFLHDLRRDGVLDRSVLALTSDHGEHLFEHGDWSHGQNLYDHQLHVPLLIRDRGPRLGGSRIEELVEVVDVMPTLLSLVGIEPRATLQGRDVSRLVRDQPKEAGVSVSFGTAVQRKPGLHSVRTRSHKLIVDLAAEADAKNAWLYDLTADPGEQRDLSAEAPALVAELRSRLEAHLAALEARGALEAEEAVIPDDVRRRLEALGYN